MRRMQKVLLDTSELNDVDKDVYSPASTALLNRRLTLAWLDGEAQQVSYILYLKLQKSILSIRLGWWLCWYVLGRSSCEIDIVSDSSTRIFPFLSLTGIYFCSEILFFLHTFRNKLWDLWTKEGYSWCAWAVYHSFHKECHSRCSQGYKKTPECVECLARRGFRSCITAGGTIQRFEWSFTGVNDVDSEPVFVV